MSYKITFRLQLKCSSVYTHRHLNELWSYPTILSGCSDMNGDSRSHSALEMGVMPGLVLGRRGSDDTHRGLQDIVDTLDGNMDEVGPLVRNPVVSQGCGKGCVLFCVFHYVSLHMCDIICVFHYVPLHMCEIICMFYYVPSPVFRYKYMLLSVIG